ncbi:MAG: S1/P1 nuclease [Pyrinomonadaceae bacterium]
MKIENKHSAFRSRVAIGVICFILITPTLSLSWGAGGHMMTAQIAFDRLNPRAKAEVRTLLAIPIDPAAVTRRSRNFVNASHWADDLRPFPEFDSFKALHFIDKTFSDDGTPLPTVPPPNIVTALEDNLNILKTSTDNNARAQALRLIIHFVGDIHQPLHCGTRVSAALPEGDRGGNEVNLKILQPNGTTKSTNLHSYWDGGIGSFPKTGPNFRPPPLSQIPPAAALAKRGNPATDPALNLNNPTDFAGWAGESNTLAIDVAYKGITNNARPTAAYNRAAKRVVRKRVAWGGYRLAALLNSIWP